MNQNKPQNSHKIAEIMKKIVFLACFILYKQCFQFPKILASLCVMGFSKSKKLLFEYDTAIKMV